MSPLKACLMLMLCAVCLTAVSSVDACRCPVYIVAPPPVCGDGKQYMDKCRAKCAGAKVITSGPCPTINPACICPAIYKPVCGDGVEYGNQCAAACAGAKRIVDGPCKPCPCPKIYLPVCGSDGVTYDNLCRARCAGIYRVKKDPCCPPCAVRCSDVYDPVCADGVTYRNSCLTICLCPKPKRVLPGECKKTGKN